jgi:pimeloyl-ACP methyl ester carboxylesterase
MLAYDRWGSFGRPVVLLHGLLFDRTMWWPVAAELASPRCTVVAPDLPGHGQSPARDVCRPEKLAAEIAQLVDRLFLRRAPIVVGHAGSAPLATAFAAGYATHAVVTLDEPPAGATGPDELVDAAGLDRVPAVFRHYARARREPALLRAYASWLAKPPTRRNHLALAGGTRSGPGRPETPFAPLTDPAGFAARLRDLL